MFVFSSGEPILGVPELTKLAFALSIRFLLEKCKYLDPYKYNGKCQKRIMTFSFCIKLDRYNVT